VSQVAGRTAAARVDAAAPKTSVSAGQRRRLVWLTLATADATAIAIAFAVAFAFVPHRPSRWLVLGVVAVVGAWWVAAQMAGLYNRDLESPEHSTLDEFVTIFNLVTAGVWLTFAVDLAFVHTLSAAHLATFWAVAMPAITVGRGCARASIRGRSAFVQRAIIVGAGDVGQLVARKLVQHPEYRIDVVGFVDEHPRELRREVRHVRLLGVPADLEQIVREAAADRVLFAFSGDSHAELLRAIRTLAGTNVQIDVVPRLFEAFSPTVDVHTVEGLPLLGLSAKRISGPERAAKRLIDLIGSSLMLTLFAPVFVLVSIAVKLDSPGPIFFRQQRLGQGMKEFTMLKFRTMGADTDDAAHREYIRGLMETGAAPEQTNLYKLDRADSITRVGQWLRRLSLDELPQLINVFRGDMSLVGPRPCLKYETELFEPHHFARFSVPAGVTGLWQVTARARSTFKEALDLDVGYARSWSLGLDLRLLFRTPVRVLKGDDTT
jgi:exopolysaccharide biosynthesis polyprenyl glycosylphosphotransferase